ncbi:uncharacterized protein LOC128796335 [Vidua chalybeata]|uniref:uncharacterized protein LOC128796335 n=1 Tax=Vidua chalybeata TaxID=81927 RepID=UPI0023A83D58|nr:uncharacterized protein LOC128796335 [Vidua chalybeata]
MYNMAPGTRRRPPQGHGAARRRDALPRLPQSPAGLQRRHWPRLSFFGTHLPGAALSPGHGRGPAHTAAGARPAFAQAAQARLRSGRGSGLRGAPAEGGQKYSARGAALVPTAVLPVSSALRRRCSPKQVRARSRGQRGSSPPLSGSQRHPACPQRGQARLRSPASFAARSSSPLLSSRVSSRPLRAAMQAQGARCVGQAGELIATV